MAGCKDVLPDCAREFGTIGESLKNGEDRDKQIIHKLDILSKVIIGNGKAGVVGRLDRLERDKARGINARWKVAVLFMPFVTAILMLLLSQLLK
jgi:hypothetical protein